MQFLIKVSRLLNFPVLQRYMMEKIKEMKNKEKTYEFINKSKAKWVMVMTSSPIQSTMFKQRAHHFADYFSKYFDEIYYYSEEMHEIVHYQDNIYCVPHLPKEKLKGKDTYFFVCNVNSLPYKSLLKIKKNGYKIIYDYRDEISDDLYETTQSRLIFNNLRKIQPEIVVASADALYKQISKVYPGKEILLSKNGVTVQDFDVVKDKNNIPKDLVAIVEQNKPIVGYYGFLASWVDIELIKYMAKQRPEYNFVYIGKRHKAVEFDMKEYPNIHFLGHKFYKDLPNYSVWFDCCTIPFVLGDIAKATSPVKLFEYMAAKKPTVCTRDLVECSGYDGVLMSEDYDDFVANLDKAIELSKDTAIQEKLYEYAKQNSWESRATVILDKIREIE